MGQSDKTLAARESWIANAAVMLASVLIALFLAEIGYRVVARMPVIRLVDWRTTRAVLNQMQGVTAYEPELGWTLKTNIRQPGFNTLDHGIRVNHGERTVSTGGILAVGDSFTAGSEVHDHQSWPAHLETVTGRPVINGGIGGYGTDQIIMRAEQLLPIVKPAMLVVGFLESDILRAGFSSYGRPKPWYEVKDGRLVHHKPSVAAFAPEASGTTELAIRHGLGHSAIADLLLSRLAPSYWYSSETAVFRRISNDEVAVTCAMIERLKARTDAANVRTLLFMQYGASNILASDTPTGIARLVNACASDLGIQVVDEFQSLRAIIKADAKAVREFYVMTGDTPGHMSSTGNLHAAELLKAGLAQAPVQRPAARAVADGPVPRAAPLHQGLERSLASSNIAKVTRGSAGEATLAAIGPDGEHYWGVGPLQSAPGASTLTLEVRAVAAATHVRLQLLDGAINGVFADVDLVLTKAATQRIGLARRPSVEVANAGGGWRRVTINADLPAEGRIVRVQLLQGTSTAFAPKGEAVALRKIALQ